VTASAAACDEVSKCDDTFGNVGHRTAQVVTRSHHTPFYRPHR
jgi:hypothetical protein